MNVKPCPFCGALAEADSGAPLGFDQLSAKALYGAEIRCTACPARMDDPDNVYGYDHLIELWNQRCENQMEQPDTGEEAKESMLKTLKAEVFKSLALSFALTFLLSDGKNEKIRKIFERIHEDYIHKSIRIRRVFKATYSGDYVPLIPRGGIDLDETIIDDTCASTRWWPQKDSDKFWDFWLGENNEGWKVEK